MLARSVGDAGAAGSGGVAQHLAEHAHLRNVLIRVRVVALFQRIVVAYGGVEATDLGCDVAGVELAAEVVEGGFQDAEGKLLAQFAQNVPEHNLDVGGPLGDVNDGVVQLHESGVLDEQPRHAVHQLDVDLAAGQVGVGAAAGSLLLQLQHVGESRVEVRPQRGVEPLHALAKHAEKLAPERQNAVHGAAGEGAVLGHLGQEPGGGGEHQVGKRLLHGGDLPARDESVLQHSQNWQHHVLLPADAEQEERGEPLQEPEGEGRQRHLQGVVGQGHVRQGGAVDFDEGAFEAGALAHLAEVALDEDEDAPQERVDLEQAQRAGGARLQQLHRLHEVAVQDCSHFVDAGDVDVRQVEVAVELCRPMDLGAVGERRLAAAQLRAAHDRAKARPERVEQLRSQHRAHCCVTRLHTRH
ncbi:FAD-binding protein [Babesia caballi]|uniref:FAD-binding protein n=1 Tax=Babesia caballi TaxID=5871 RepID=A0AAV4LPA8_BABCB|nr:FAD-binding protein [Babesia caballi]